MIPVQSLRQHNPRLPQPLIKVIISGCVAFPDVNGENSLRSAWWAGRTEYFHQISPCGEVRAQLAISLLATTKQGDVFFLHPGQMVQKRACWCHYRPAMQGFFHFHPDQQSNCFRHLQGGRVALRILHQGAKQGAYIQSRRKPPETTDHFCCETFPRSWNANQRNPFGGRQAIGSGFLRESSLAQAQPFFEDTKTTDIIR